MIVKVHPGAYIDPENQKSSGGIDWKAFFEAENLRKNRIVNAYQVDSPEYVMASDITITDISTIWIEYYFLHKPIIFLDIPKFFSTHEKNSLGDFRDTYGYLVKTEEELDRTIQDILSGKSEAKRGPNIDDTLLYNKGAATKKAVGKIEELFHSNQTL
jgi:CDP-glycerol glycerophosphotransferase (TagB/SpsB family)